MPALSTKKKNILRLLFFLLLVVATVWILRRHNTPYQTNTGTIFGTSYHITYQSPSDFHPQLQAEMQQVDLALSLFNPNSWLSRYNAGETPSANALAEEVISLAMRISNETSGAFDITVAPLVNAWGFGNKKATPPTQSQIDSLLKVVGYQRYLSGQHVLLDCGAIAKGYAVDRVATLLRSHGVQNFMVEIGGEVIAEGHNPDGNPWQIAITKPTDAQGEIQEILPLSHVAMATSGNYRNFRTDSLGRRYAHTIDPRLGRPIQQSLLSATILAPTCAEADAYATACMVLGTDEAIRFLSSHKDIQYYFICAKDTATEVKTNITKD